MIIVNFSWAWVLGIPDLYSIVSFSEFRLMFISGERRGSYDGYEMHHSVYLSYDALQTFSQDMWHL